uniref:Uncharacterized protein n=1 Tax=Candidatus Nitrotoga fabula TaxID=2182327 RepID=A0A2X0QUP7_9PROT|nr:protein of unknown function [Candidatus Nitrotoga fabula]
MAVSRSDLMGSVKSRVLQVSKFGG